MSNNYLNGESVELAEMLLAREQRVAAQRELLEKHPEQTLVSATMNIPGPVKTNETLKYIFSTVMNEIKERFANEIITTCAYKEKKTGPEYFLIIASEPLVVKEKMIQIETTHRYGRLVDLDVLYLKSKKLDSLSRTHLKVAPRTCYVCGKDAKICGRQRTHSVSEMQEAINKLIEEGKMK